MSLRGKTIFITGASRGIGKAIALRAARDGANVAIVSKTAEPRLTVVEVEKAGGRALPLICDIRDEEQVMAAIQKTVDTFGGIDIVVNNASAISLAENAPVNRFDVMHSMNSRGTWVVSKYAIPYLKQSSNPHILNISPPLDMSPEWFAPNVAYSMDKIGMSLSVLGKFVFAYVERKRPYASVLGMASELREDGIAVNALWPLTAIDNDALHMMKGVDSHGARTPDIMADAAHAILTRPSRQFTGNFCIDELVLLELGVTDFDKYAVVPGTKDFQLDCFIDEASVDHVREVGARQSHI